MPNAHAYTIQAYDKDRDVWDTLCNLTNFQLSEYTARSVMAFFAALIHSENIKTAQGTPYDWVELYDGDNRIDFS